MHKQWSVCASNDGVAMARRLAADAFDEAGVSRPAQQALILVVSELVTNAVVHAHPPLTLSVDISDERARIEVTDAVNRVPHVRTVSRQALGGRGLALVEHLASSWGTRLDDDGKAVWFELALDEASEPLARRAPSPAA